MNTKPVKTTIIMKTSPGRLAVLADEERGWHKPTPGFSYMDVCSTKILIWF